MEAIVCPPYDVISPQEQQGYYQKNDYNVVRLELGKEMEDDTTFGNKYTRARDTFIQWLNDDILQVDNTPTYYIHEHTFTSMGNTYKRLGLIACVLLEPWEKKMIMPHENTLSGVKRDRLDLMRACAANFSPIWGLYEDPGQRVAQLMSAKVKQQSKLLVNFTQGDDVHKLWMANEPEFVQRASYFLAPKPIYIADGHHRYETSLAYRDEKRQNAASHTGEEAYNFVMMTLISFSDPGLVILPIHRLIRGLDSQTVQGLTEKLSEFFELKFISLDEQIPETQETAILVLGLEPGRLAELKLRPSVSIEQYMPEGHSKAYRSLEVSIVQHVIIETLLGITDEDDLVSYTPSTDAARKFVEAGQYQLAFLLNPISAKTIKEIVDASDRMPRKSTYFHPKLPSGLVINRLEGTIV
jgi:uncharacterized protein (DUF1015 family)